MLFSLVISNRVFCMKHFTLGGVSKKTCECQHEPVQLKKMCFFRYLCLKKLNLSIISLKTLKMLPFMITYGHGQKKTGFLWPDDIFV